MPKAPPGERVKCHSCGSRNPGCFVPATVELWRKLGLDHRESASVLDCRFRGRDTWALTRQPRGELHHSAKVLLGADIQAPKTLPIG
jgi:hypothetical protein